MYVQLMYSISISVLAETNGKLMLAMMTVAVPVLMLTRSCLRAAR